MIGWLLDFLFGPDKRPLAPPPAPAPAPPPPASFWPAETDNWLNEAWRKLADDQRKFEEDLHAREMKRLSRPSVDYLYSLHRAGLITDEDWKIYILSDDGDYVPPIKGVDY